MNQNDKNYIQILNILTLISAILETIGAIPFLGGLVIVGTLWVLLIAMICLNVAGIVISANVLGTSKDQMVQQTLQQARSKYITVLILDIVAIIPIIGWICHIAGAIIAWTNYSKLYQLEVNETQK